MEVRESKVSFMFRDVGDAIEIIRQKFEQEKAWLESFSKLANQIDILPLPWMENKFIHKIPKSIPSIAKISGVDGGLISEALAGLDLILYRAVGVTFSGIGQKVKASYTPSFDPEPAVYIGPSLQSRQEFQKLATLYRLIAEYEIAIETIKAQNPSVLFLDGRVIPLKSDFQEIPEQASNISQIENSVRKLYLDLIRIAEKKNVLLCGIIKDSRSRSLTKTMEKIIPEWIRDGSLRSEQLKGWRKSLDRMLDHNFCNGILNQGQRTAWIKSKCPDWVSQGDKFSVWSCLVKPIKEDLPIKVEILHTVDQDLALREVAMGALSVLSNHGLPIAIPTIILEADERVKLKSDHLENIINEISVAFGISADELRKRRNFRSSIKN